MEAQLPRRDGGSADGRQRAHHSVGPPGRLFARIVGAHRRQGRRRAGHAALRHRRRKFFKIAERHTPSSTPGRASTPRISEKVAENVSGQDLGYFFIQWIESQRRARVQAGIHHFPHRQGLPRHGQNLPGSGHVPHAGGPEDRDRRQSRREARRSGRHLDPSSRVDTFGKPKTSSSTRNNRVLRYSPQMRVAVAIRRGEAVCGIERIRRGAQGISEGARHQPQQFAGPLPHRRGLFPAEQLSVGRQRVPRGPERRSRPQVDRGLGHINLGKIFDITGQRERAVNEYNLAIRTKDNTQGAQEEAGKYLKTPYERQRRIE